MNETQNVLWNMTDYRYVAFYIVSAVFLDQKELRHSCRFLSCNPSVYLVKTLLDQSKNWEERRISIREITNTNSDLIFYNDILNTFWWHSFITVCIFESWQVAQRMKISKDRIHAILWHLYDFFNNLWNISILI